MKLLSIYHVKIATVVELLAPWPGGFSYRQPGNHSGKLLQRTSDTDEVPDTRYWTAYDHFMTEHEARVQRAACFYGLLAHGWRKLKAALTGLARRLSGPTQP